MKSITIPVQIPVDVMLALNESEQELKIHFQTAVAIMLYQEGKLTLGKSIQLSGLSRFEFEKALLNRKIPISSLSLDQIKSDVDKLSDL